MRPPKSILLVGTDEEDVGALKFTLAHGRVRSNHSYYIVKVASDTEKAASLLSERLYDLLICVWPIESCSNLLDKARLVNPDMRTLLLAYSDAGLPMMYVDAILKRTSNADLMACVAIMLHRKRGPKPVRTYSNANGNALVAAVAKIC
jgi:hypothetical protein